MDSAAELGARLVNRAARRKAVARVVGGGVEQRREAARIDRERRRIRTQRARRGGEFGHALPRRRQRGQRRRRAIDLHARDRLDHEFAMRRINADTGDAIVEDVGALAAHLRHGRDLDPRRQHALALLLPRPEAQCAGVDRHRPAVAVTRQMGDVVDHARPRIFSARACEAPCRKYRDGDRLGQRRQLLLERENPLVLDLVGVFGCELRAEQGGEPYRLLRQSVLAKQRQRGDMLGDQLGLKRHRARVEGVEQRHVAHRGERDADQRARAIGDLRIDEIEQHVEVMLGRLLIARTGAPAGRY